VVEAAVARYAAFVERGTRWTILASIVQLYEKKS